MDAIHLHTSPDSLRSTTHGFGCAQPTGTKSFKAISRDSRVLTGSEGVGGGGFDANGDQLNRGERSESPVRVVASRNQPGEVGQEDTESGLDLGDEGRGMD